MVRFFPLNTKKQGFVITPRGAREASYLVALMREKNTRVLWHLETRANWSAYLGEKELLGVIIS